MTPPPIFPDSLDRRSFLSAILTAAFLKPAFSLAADANTDAYFFDSAWTLHASESYPKPCQISGLAIAKNGSLLVLNRGENPWSSKAGFDRKLVHQPTLLVVNPETGVVTRVWGEDTFVMPHQVDVDSRGHVWISDVGQNSVTQFDADGNKLLELGGKEIGFKKPTATGFLSDGSIVVSDGYENSRIAKLSPEGKLLASWGTKGKEPLQFKIPHGIAVDDEDHIYVADRENHRVQVLNANGEVLAVWTNVEQAVSIRFLNGSLYVLSNLVAAKGIVRRMNKQGEVLESFQTYPKSGWEGYESPHGLAVGDNGDTIYVGFVGGKRVQRYRKNK